MNRTRITAIVITMILATASLSGCRYRITDKSVEDEVAEALETARAEWEVETERKVAEAEKAAEERASSVKTQTAVAENVPKPDETVMTDPDLDKTEVPITTADETGNVESVIEEPDDGVLQIVFMGDSIFDSVRDETGIAHMVGAQLGADIYNLSIGGTTCALRIDKSYELDKWTEPSFMGVVYSMEGKVDRSILKGYKSGEVMELLDPSKTDYFIIQYGTNDFTSYIPIGSTDTKGQFYYYFYDTLSLGIRELRQNYPDAQIILCTPYYEQFWSADRTRYIGDAHVVNNGFGFFMDYINCVQNTAMEWNLPCLYMYDLMGIDIYNIDNMTEDGIHPNEEARRKYADILVNKINELEAQKGE